MPSLNTPTQLRSLQRRATATRVALIVFCLILAILLFGAAGQFFIMPFFDIFYVSAFLMGLGIWTALASIVVLIPLSLWIWRAHANLRDGGSDGLRWSPVSATAASFIPVFNLIAPHRAMRELANRSAGEGAHAAAEDVPLVSSWWSCFLAGALMLGAMTFVGAVNVLTRFKITSPPAINLALAALALALLIAGAVFLFRLVGMVTRDQQGVVSIGEAFA